MPLHHRQYSSGSGSSSFSRRIRVERKDGEWWTFNTGLAEAWWSEEDASHVNALYPVQDDVWVLHRRPIDTQYDQLARSVDEDGHVRAEYRLSGKARQLNNIEAAQWLLRFGYSLPDLLRALKDEVLRNRPNVEFDPEFVEEVAVAPLDLDEFVASILRLRNIAYDHPDRLSPEQKRNIVMFHWRDAEGLTPAKIRDKWYDSGWKPRLRVDDKTGAAQNVKTYIKRGKKLVGELADKK